MPLFQENWDSAIPPAVPAAWNAQANVATTGAFAGGVTPTSSPNALTTSIAASSSLTCTYATLDGNGGDVSVRANTTWTWTVATPIFHVFGLMARGSASTLDFSGTTFYWATIDFVNQSVAINKVVSGTVTPIIGVIAIGTLTPAVWLQATFTLTGTSLSFSVQRLSDGFWLNSSGVWAAPVATAILITDGSISGAGYSGVTLGTNIFAGTSNAYSDDFVLSATSSAAPPVYTQPQTFDDVTAPALPTGFTFDLGLATTATFSHGIVPVTSPNALVLSVSGVSTIFAGTSATIDASGGDVTVMGYVNSPQTTNDQVAGLMARGSAYPIDPIADSYYWLEQDYNALEARLSVVLSGGPTLLSSVAISELENPGWYLLVLAVNGIDLQAFIQRQSDLAWLDPSGNWVPTYQSALSATDSSIAGSGYLGMTLVSRDDVLYLDSYQSRGAISKTLAAPFYDRVFEGGSCQGINDCLLLGHFSSYQSFAVVGDGNPTGYAITDPVNDAWEIGFGTYNALVPSLSRNTVAASSNMNQFVNFVPGSKDVFTSISARYIQRTQVTLFDSFVDVSNITTTETDLVSNSLPGNMLAFDGDKISARYAVTLVSSASTKRVRVYFAGSLIHDGLALTTSGSGNVVVDVLIIRDSATSVRYAVSSTAYLATPQTVQSVSLLGSLILTGPLILKLTGQAAGGAAASSDLVTKLSSVSLVPAAT